MIKFVFPENNLIIEKSDIWLNYFKNLYKDIPEEEPTGEQKYIFKRLNDIEEKNQRRKKKTLDVPVTLQEIRGKIQHLQTKKKPVGWMESCQR